MSQMTMLDDILFTLYKDGSAWISRVTHQFAYGPAAWDLFKVSILVVGAIYLYKTWRYPPKYLKLGIKPMPAYIKVGFPLCFFAYGSLVLIDSSIYWLRYIAVLLHSIRSFTFTYLIMSTFLSCRSFLVKIKTDKYEIHKYDAALVVYALLCAAMIYCNPF